MSERLKDLIEDGLESTLSKVYEELKITTGDISPEQSLVWDDIILQTATLFDRLIEQNLPQEPEVQINVVYMPIVGKSVIFKETYLFGDIQSTEIVGWYYGEPNDDDTQTFIGKLKAEYTMGGADNE